MIGFVYIVAYAHQRWRSKKNKNTMDDLNPLAGTAHLLEEVDSEYEEQQ